MTAAVAGALAEGILFGGVYALMALSLTLKHSVLHFVDFAHGSLLTVAMFTAWVLAARFDIDPYASLPLVALLLFAAGWGLYRLVIGPASQERDARRDASARERAGLLATAGIAAVASGAMLAMFGPGARRIGMAYTVDVVRAGPVSVRQTAVVAGLSSFGLAAFLWLFMTQTDTGRSIRAVAREPEGARLVGIQPDRMAALAYGIGAACLGASGCLLLPGLAVSPGLAPGFLLVSFAAVLLGGLGSFAGAVLGGLAVGVVERLGLLAGSKAGAVAVGLVLLLALWGRAAGRNKARGGVPGPA